MANKELKTRIKNKRDAAVNWEFENPVILNGEIILVDTNTGELRAKVGDGTKHYKDLPFSDEVLRSLISGKANTSHTHDDRYYTETEIDNKFSSMVGDKSVSTQISSAISTKANTSDLTSHTGNTTVHITAAERTKWNAAKTHADSAHAPSNAEANQNAFSNVIVGSTTIAADSKTDSITLVGSNVTLTPDATNDKITIGITKDNITSALGSNPVTEATHATSATQDASGNTITTTYETKTDATAKLNSAKKYTDDEIAEWVGDKTVSTQISTAISNVTPASIGAAASSHGTHVSYGTSATAIGATASAGSASTVSRSDHTHSLSKAAVTTALGYTPPTSDTTYSAGTGISLSGTTFSNSGVRSIATGTTNGTISVNTNGTSANVAVKGLGSAAYTNTAAYDPAGAAADAYESAQTYANSKCEEAKTYTNNKVASYLPLSGGTLTGSLKIGSSSNLQPVYFSGSCYMPNSVFYNAYDKDGTACCIVGITNAGNLTLGTNDYPHSGDTRVVSKNGSVYLTNKIGSIIFNSSSGSGYNCVFRPSSSSVNPLLGSSSYPWSKIYATTTTVQSSDERVKSNIMSIADYPSTYSRDGSENVFEKLFKKLIPKTYTMNAEDTNELHIGFVAQDIEKALEELGLTVDDLSIIEHNYWVDEETGEEKDKYGLAYTEFIALNTYIIQKQQEEIELLKERITNLEELANK